MASSCRRTADTSPRPGPQRRLFSPTSERERAQTGRRLLWALPVALVLLVVVTLLGPSAEEVERKLTIYGTEGPLRLMPEIVIEDGRDAVEARAWREQARPPAAPHYEVEPIDPDPRATEPVPPERQVIEPTPQTATARDQADQESLVDLGIGDAAADLHMPAQQVDADFIIRKLVRPLYPVRASAEDRLKPVVEVEGAFYVNERAEIVAVMIQRNEGGPEFADAARLAMEQWEFEARWRDGKPPRPRWLVTTWRFRSPLAGDLAP